MQDPKPNVPVKLISELVANPDFPESAVGENVDINGQVGTIVDVVKNSIKVRDAEGHTRSYNFNTLRRLYGPRPEPTTPPPLMTRAEPPPPKAPPREIILEPNFNSPLVSIEQVIDRSDYPKCTFGQFLDLHGYTGVVVEIIGNSLKVRSKEGTTRSYNADGLRNIYRPNASKAVG